MTLQTRKEARKEAIRNNQSGCLQAWGITIPRTTTLVAGTIIVA